MSRANPEPVAIAILAKAPVAGFAKTRLIPILGAHGAAALQERLMARALETAIAAATGPVTLWCEPNQDHVAFRTLAARKGLQLRAQPKGDLGARMLAAIQASKLPTLVIGTDCPALTAAHLRDAADTLRDGNNAVFFPAEDGGYVLAGLRRAQPVLFADMAWSTDTVMAETRRRLRELGFAWREPAELWDVDRPGDVWRLKREGFGHLLDGLAGDEPTVPASKPVPQPR